MPKFASNLDLQKNELQNARVQNLSGAPSTPVEGQIYQNTTDHHYYIWNGSAWKQCEGYQPLATFLTNLSALGGGSIGFVVKNADGTTQTRSIVQGTGIVVSNGDGVSSVPTVALQSGIATPGTSPKVTYDTYGRVTSGSALSASDIPSLTASKISDFDSQVRVSRLDQMAIPTSDISMNSRKITNLANPVTLQDAATKAYVDNVAQGLSAKTAVRCATTTNITLSSFAGTIDGVTLAQGDRVLVKNQTVQSENGIYYGGVQPMTRCEDADAWTDLTSAYVWVQEGSTQADTGWLCTSDKGGTLGTTAVTWVQFSGAGQIIAGSAIIITGNTIDVRTGDGINPTGYNGDISIKLAATSGLSTATGALAIGAGTGITVGTNTISVTNPKLKYSADCATSNPWTVTHNLGTQDLVVAVYEKSTWAIVLCDIVNTNTNTTTITFAATPTSAQYRVVILG